MVNADGRIDLAHQHGRAVLIEHALRLGRGGGGIDRVFRDDLDLASHDAAGLVDLLLGHSDAQLGVGAERTEKAGQRREVADLDLVRLRADDRRKAESERAGQCGAALQYASSCLGGHPLSPPMVCLWRLALPSFVSDVSAPAPDRTAGR